jgi:hypothetical protein
MLRLGVGLGAAEPSTEATSLPSSDLVHAAAATSKSGSRQTTRKLLLISDLLRFGRPKSSRRPATPPSRRL